MEKLSQIRLSRVNFPLIEKKLKNVSSGDLEKALQLDVEKASLESEQETVRERNQRLNAEIESKDVEVGVLQSKLEDPRSTSQLTEKIRLLEEQLKSAQSKKESFGEVRYKQGRVYGLHIGADLGFDKGYHLGYQAFPRGKDMRTLVEAYR